MYSNKAFMMQNYVCVHDCRLVHIGPYTASSSEAMKNMLRAQLRTEESEDQTESWATKTSFYQIASAVRKRVLGTVLYQLLLSTAMPPPL
jgi:hypothetical protein